MRANLSKEQVFDILAAELSHLRQTYGVVRMPLNGSLAHGSPTSRRDVDLLAETSRPLEFEFIALADYLEKRLGRKVDLAASGRSPARNCLPCFSR